MATAAKLKPVAVDEPGTDIAVIIAQDHAVALLDREKFNAFYDRLKADAPTDVDIATNKGRDTIRSYAAKVRSEKAAIDKDRLRLTKEWRDLTAQVNSAGKEIDEQLEALAVEVRAPLTAWEEAEKARVAECERIVAGMKAAAVVTLEDTSATVRQRGSDVYNTILDIALFGDAAASAVTVQESAIATLKTALARLTQEESDRAELEKLRAAEAERVRIEEEKAAAAEIERKRVEAERLAEERKAAAERAEADRIAAAEKAAEDRVRREAEERHVAELAAEREKSAALEREAQVERERLAEIERQRIAQEAADRAAAQKIADEQAEREKNKAHRARVKTAAKLAIMTCGADEETAQKIVLAIIAGEVPAVAMDFRS